MTCGWISRRLDRYRECALGLTETLLVRWHLSRCPKCHAQYEREETVGSLLAALPVAAPPSGLELRILSALSVEALMRGSATDVLEAATGPVRQLAAADHRARAGRALLLALILVPMLLSAVWMEPVAHADDVPLRLLASPVVSAPMMTLPSPYPVADEIAVVAYIDAHGGVYGLRDRHAGAARGSRPPTTGQHAADQQVPARDSVRPSRFPSSRVLLFQSVESAA